MVDHRNIRGKVGRGALVVALAGAMAVGGSVPAFAALGDQPLGDNPTGAAVAAGDLLRSYGVRAGSAGPDYVGVTNTNYDFTAGSASQSDQYTGYTSSSPRQLAGISIWGTDVNESMNPYYANLLYHALTGNAATGAEATTWMSNPTDSSWGDSNGTVTSTGIAGTEYSPQIIFGANKLTNWEQAASGEGSGTNFYTKGYYTGGSLAPAGQTITYTSNDATNIFTQIYSLGQLAEVAKGYTNDKTRYDATQSAINYERATKGQMLYIASKIDAGAVAKQKVAYLYAIDKDGTAYFFTPEASGLTSGTGTNGAATNSQSSPNTSYAANNSTINMGYMAMLPFVTDTFTGGTEVSGGIVMKVEDIFSSNPAVSVPKASEDGDSALAGVDVIIFNTTKNTDLAGTSGGKNSSGVNNDYLGSALTSSKVQTWAAAHGFNGRIIAGDDFGTSSNQVFDGDSAIEGQAPMLYCQRNYTADKNARAAWAFSQVYPSLYGNNANATYGYWVDAVYHVNTADVPTVVGYMTNQDGVTYDSTTAATVEANAEAGYTWYQGLSSRSIYKTTYAYYSGASRASYYSGDAQSQEVSDTIGIFAPSSLWQDAHQAQSTQE